MFNSLKDEGLGEEITNRQDFIEGLKNRGISLKDAQEQYEAEQLHSQVFSINSSLVYTPSMKITFGEVKN